jgi:hypothetical protein
MLNFSMRSSSSGEGENMRLLNIRSFAAVGTVAALLLSGCSDTVTNHIRQRDFRQLGKGEVDAKQAASPIANVFDMPGWTTDLESARAFASVNGQKTVLFFYREEQGASDTAKTRLNALSSSTGTMQRVAVDVSKAPQVAAQYGAQNTPAIVVLDPAGNAIAQQSGELTKNQIAYLLR